jgi:nucleoside-triphosphatase
LDEADCFFISEIREANTRKGFELRSLNGEEGLFAHVDIATPYRVGKCKVDVKEFEAFLGAIPLLGPSVRVTPMALTTAAMPPV